MPERDVRAVVETVLSRASADHTEVVIQSTRRANTRFANNAITQNTARRDAVLTVRAAFGNQVGEASVNDFSEESLHRAVERAEGIARVAAADNEYLPPPGPQTYAAVDAYDERVAEATPEQRADAVAAAIAAATQADGLKAAGSFATDSQEVVVANSNGLFASHRQTAGRFIITAIGADSSGWAQSSGVRWDHVDPTTAAERAAAKALAGRNPQRVEPGEYTVVMEPAAVADYFGYLLYSLDAKTADEGRSAFTGRLGDRVGPEWLTLRSQADHPDSPACPIGEGGLPVPSTRWIANGVIANLAHGRYWAHHAGKPFTGRPVNLLFSGQDRALDDLVADVERGILVTRFWYIRYVDPMQLLLTGMTRDGLFWIEDGQVRHGLTNMRFNESPLRCLERVSAASRPERVNNYTPASVPGLRAERFPFTSGTAF